MADIIERDRGPRGRRLVLLLFAHVLVFSSFLLLPQSARAASYQPNSREATERDKDTHRAVRAESTYDLTDASHRFTSQAFAGGLRTDAQVFSNFEDWRIGTHGWTLNGDHDSHAPTRGAHFNSFSFALLPALVARTGTTLRFDTDAATVVYGSVTQNGAATQVSDGAATKVVVFNFESIVVESGVNFEVVGSKPLVILCRSSIKLNSTATVAPGTLGAFTGASIDTANNANGPGSGSVRVYMHTVSTSGTDRNEVQRISTFADPGQTLHGGFRVQFKGQQTTLLAHDIQAHELKARLESSIPRMGKVAVTRSGADAQGGRNWTVTYLTAVGDVPQLTVTNELPSIGSAVIAETLVDGNSIGGAFTISFLGSTTRSLRFDATADEVRTALLEDVPEILTAYVSRTDPDAVYQTTDGRDYATTMAAGTPNAARPYHVGLCEHGGCANGVGPAGGLTWTITTTTMTGNVAPLSPTASNVAATGTVSTMSASSSLTGAGAVVTITAAHTLPGYQSMHGLQSLQNPFSLAFGGGGAGHAGPGGSGLGDSQRGQAYGDIALNSMLGGSGGSAGGVHPDAVLRYAKVYGISSPGGDGGGVVELAAVNDIIIGSEGGFRCNAQAGNSSQMGGGGGSGGGIVISAGGVLDFHGILEANGGDGGDAVSPNGRPGGGGSGGRIAVYAQSILNTGIIRAVAGAQGSCLATGGDCQAAVGAAVASATATGNTVAAAEGTVKVEARFGLTYITVNNTGAQHTQRSLILRGGSVTATESGVPKPTPYHMHGPQYNLGGGASGARPGRVTVYMKMGDYVEGSVLNNQGAYFALHSESPSTKIVVAFGIADGAFRHGAGLPNIGSGPRVDPTATINELKRHIVRHRWYKVDVFLDWTARTYDVRIDDYQAVTRATFSSTVTGVKRLGLYNLDAATYWFDEIFVGRDDSMMFRCPTSTTSGVHMERPNHEGWAASSLGLGSSFHTEIRHSSHLSQRDIYNYKCDGGGCRFPQMVGGGLVPGDGYPHRRFRSDVKTKTSHGDHTTKAGVVTSGALLSTNVEGGVSPTMRKHLSTTATEGANWFEPDIEKANREGSTTTYYWYADHSYPAGESYLQGGIGACSTRDFITWKNEGIMLHYINITAPAGNTGPYHIERPKVIKNNSTNKFVMWMGVDNAAKALGLAGVATANHADGPFTYASSFLPNGNYSYDHTVFKDERTGKAYLARTYYAQVDYRLPTPVMQPLWESVKYMNNPKQIDFGLNYHRGFYEVEYDNKDDICTQRLRMEDKDYKVDRPQDFCNEHPAAFPPLPPVTRRGMYSVISHAATINPDNYKNPQCKRKVEGQGWPKILSRFKYRKVPTNTMWQPSSVPSVKTQSWLRNYEDGNIADNPSHATVPDKLIGPSRIVESRHSKYIAVSLLADDYLTTTDVLRIVEGEMDDELDMIEIIDSFGQFGWESGTWRGTTEAVDVWGSATDQLRFRSGTQAYLGTVERQGLFSYLANANISTMSFDNEKKKVVNFTYEDDWETRYWQYLSTPGDRRSAPINFKDQLTYGRTVADRSLLSVRQHEPWKELDRNCFIKGEAPFPWTNREDLINQGKGLYQHNSTWNVVEAGGGNFGSSDNYDYENQRNYFDPRWYHKDGLSQAYHYAATEETVRTASEAIAVAQNQYLLEDEAEKTRVNNEVDEMNNRGSVDFMARSQKYCPPAGCHTAR